MPSPTVSTGLEFWLALGILALGVIFVARILQRDPTDNFWHVFVLFAPLAAACFWASGDLVGKIVGWLTRTLGN